MLKFTIINEKLFVKSITLLTNKITEKLGLPQPPQLNYQQLADDRFSAGAATPTIVEETYPIPPYDDPLY